MFYLCQAIKLVEWWIMILQIQIAIAWKMKSTATEKINSCSCVTFLSTASNLWLLKSTAVKVKYCLETDPMVFVGEFAAAAKHQRVSIRAPPACISSPTCWRRHCKRTPNLYYRTPKPQFNRTQGCDWAGHHCHTFRHISLAHFLVWDSQNQWCHISCGFLTPSSRMVAIIKILVADLLLRLI